MGELIKIEIKYLMSRAISYLNIYACTQKRVFSTNVKRGQLKHNEYSYRKFTKRNQSKIIIL